MSDNKVETELLSQIKEVLLKFPKYWEKDVLLRNKVAEDLRNYNQELIEALLSNQLVKDTYSISLNSTNIFKIEEFISMLRYKNYWENSYTKYSNEIGLTSEGKYLNYNTDIVLDPTLLNISADIRQIVLIIILTRAGLSLDLKDLKKVGRPAILLSFVPASFEILGVMVFAPLLLGVSLMDAAILGAVLGAVSPAVVVPRMITLIHDKFGTKKGIPQLVLAGSSVDDIYALILFSSFLSLSQSGEFNLINLLSLPLSILSGVLIGFLSGYLLSKFFEKIHLKPLIQVLILLSLSFVLVSIEDSFANLPFSGILAVMSLAIMLYRQIPEQAEKISQLYNTLWIPGEIFLFILVGASVNIQYAFSAGFLPILVILFALGIRMIGTWLSLIGTDLDSKEKTFTLIAYLPKATVQAAIGGVPLAMGLPAGELILTMSVLAILITAPLGAFGIDFSYRKLLTDDS